VLGKVLLDRSLNVMDEEFAITVPGSVRVLVGAVEELVELTLPALAGLGWWQARRMHSPPKGVAPLAEDGLPTT
jgi:hypothetical protein